MDMLRIGLIGEYNPAITAHRAINAALPMVADGLGLEVDAHWLPTDLLEDSQLAGLDGIWCVPGSPYRSLGGALQAIRFAREHGVPFLGTCGGFQHALLEYARNVLGWVDAEHAETSPAAANPIIAPLSCPLVEVRASIRLTQGSAMALAYGSTLIEEGFRCRYGPVERLKAALENTPLRACGFDDTGAVRAVELQGHPFFVACLFQPERAALEGRTPPLVNAWLQACGVQANVR
jgi:CTP synthase (UTP-ammonia lyase)